MSFRIQVAGLQEFVARASAAPDLIGQALEQGVQRAALLVEGRAKEKAPVRTGTLRRSITSVVLKEGNQVVGVIGTNVRYAPYVELGVRRSAARPYLVPALQESAEEIGGIIEQAIKQVTA